MDSNEHLQLIVSFSLSYALFSAQWACALRRNQSSVVLLAILLIEGLSIAPFVVSLVIRSSIAYNVTEVIYFLEIMAIEVSYAIFLLHP